MPRRDMPVSFPRPLRRNRPCAEGDDRLRRLGGGLRSWLAVRCTRTSALNLTAPPLLRLLRRNRPCAEGDDRLRCLGGGLRSWLAVR